MTIANTPERRGRTVAATVAGNFVEYFDWLVFGLYAPLLARAFFPHSSTWGALLATFTAYGAGMLFRPLGGILMGALADRVGRRFVLLLSIGLMGGGSLLIGILPPYASIGLAAPVLLFVARAAQGLSAGGEWPTAVSYLMELAPRNRTCFYGSIFAISSAAGGLAASGVGLALGAAFGTAGMQAWAWRIPFLTGALLCLGLLFLRRQLAESEAFVRVRELGARPSLRTLLAEHRGAVLLAATFVTGVTVHTTTWTTVAPALAQAYAGAPPSVVYAALSAAIMVSIVVQLPLGLLADRVGVRPFLAASLLGFGIGGPIALANLAPTTGRLWAALSVGFFFFSVLAAIQPTLMASLFPTYLRAGGIGLPHAIASAVAGGLTPPLATYLAAQGRLTWFLAVMAAAALLAWIAGALALRRVATPIATPAEAPLEVLATR
jgi:MHS family alpha-ketoglutarate permease-like MFS transporter